MKCAKDFALSVVFWVGFVVVPALLGLLFFAFLAVAISRDAFVAAALHVRGFLKQFFGDSEHVFLDLRR